MYFVVIARRPENANLRQKSVKTCEISRACKKWINFLWTWSELYN